MSLRMTEAEIRGNARKFLSSFCNNTRSDEFSENAA